MAASTASAYTGSKPTLTAPTTRPGARSWMMACAAGVSCSMTRRLASSTGRRASTSSVTRAKVSSATPWAAASAAATAFSSISF